MSFQWVLAQEKAVAQLRKAIQNQRISHAYIFYGPEGVGKQFCAIQFAKTLLCQNTNRKNLDESCDECVSCLQIEKNEHPNLIKLEPAPFSVLKIEEIRQVRKEVSHKSFSGNWRIYIFNDCEKITPQAANCILKTLEEPPAKDIILILLTQDLSLLLPTIVSRCQIIKFNRIPSQIIEKYLLEKIPSLSKEQASLISILSEGSLGKALSLSQQEVWERRKKIIEFMNELNSPSSIISGKIDSLYFFTFSEEEKKEIIDIISIWLRDLLIYKLTNAESLIINKDFLDLIKKNISYYDKKQIYAIITKLCEIKRNLLFRNINLEIALESIFYEKSSH